MGKASRRRRERVNASTVPPTGGRPKWLLPVAAGALLVVIVAIVLALVLGGKKSGGQGTITQDSGVPAWPAAAALPGLLTTDAPWPANQAQMPGRLEALGLPTLPQEALVEHIHQHLDMYVDGKKIGLPALVGILPLSATSADFSELHVHDTSGIVHVEAASQTQFYLGQFFLGSWGVRLDASCIGGYCAHGNETLRAYVDGKRFTGDPRTIPLRAHEEIVLAFGTPAQLPKPIPSHYAFPHGL